MPLSWDGMEYGRMCHPLFKRIPLSQTDNSDRGILYILLL